jgi:hypothetical protein
MEKYLSTSTKISYLLDFIQTGKEKDMEFSQMHRFIMKVIFH